VNLNQEAGEQYLQVAMTLLVPDQAQADLIKLYMPMVRNRLLTLLSSKKASELATIEGKQKLADDIKARLQQPFVTNSAPAVISHVLFTSFVIQ
jgi:flagellar FliL protein